MTSLTPVWAVSFEPGQFTPTGIGGLNWNLSEEKARTLYARLLTDPDYIENDLNLYREEVPTFLVQSNDLDTITDMVEALVFETDTRSVPLESRFAIGATGPGAQSQPMNGLTWAEARGE